MVKAGELGGVLEVVLARLAEYSEKANKLKNKIVSAMVYPVIVMFIAVAIHDLPDALYRAEVQRNVRRRR